MASKNRHIYTIAVPALITLICAFGISGNVHAEGNIESRIEALSKTAKFGGYSINSDRIDNLLMKYYDDTAEDNSAEQPDENWDDGIVIRDEDDYTVSDMIFVGDSRVVGMQMSSGRYHYIGEISTGYDWMVNTAEGILSSTANAYPDADIVFCFGVNDVGNIGAYINEYFRLLSIYGDRLWLMSVNPIEDGAASANGYFANNGMVVNFNQSLKEAFPDRYIDCYTEMMTEGYDTMDGVHYTAGTYLDIEDYTKELIENAEDV